MYVGKRKVSQLLASRIIAKVQYVKDYREYASRLN